MPEADVEQVEWLRTEVARRSWYHTIELAPGVVTPGWFDLRPVASRVPMPASLAGLRCLDVGTFDGFWAFEMERRGASEVVALDVPDPRQWDWPAGATAEAIEAIGERLEGGGFALAREALGSRVERHELSVYELDRERLGGFDFVYCGSLLLHLRDPVRALERIASVCDGAAAIEDAIDLGLALRAPRTPAARLDGRGRPWWWKANPAGLARMVEAGGFEVVEGPRRLRIPLGPGQSRPRLSLRALLGAGGLEHLQLALTGTELHAVLRARPARPPAQPDQPSSGRGRN